jgi:hypothetical protein
VIGPYSATLQGAHLQVRVDETFGARSLVPCEFLKRLLLVLVVWQRVWLGVIPNTIAININHIIKIK